MTEREYELAVVRVLREIKHWPKEEPDGGNVSTVPGGEEGQGSQEGPAHFYPFTY